MARKLPTEVEFGDGFSFWKKTDDWRSRWENKEKELDARINKKLEAEKVSANDVELIISSWFNHKQIDKAKDVLVIISSYCEHENAFLRRLFLNCIDKDVNIDLVERMKFEEHVYYIDSGAGGHTRELILKLNGIYTFKNSENWEDWARNENINDASSGVWYAHLNDNNQFDKIVGVGVIGKGFDNLENPKRKRNKCGKFEVLNDNEIKHEWNLKRDCKRFETFEKLYIYLKE